MTAADWAILRFTLGAAALSTALIAPLGVAAGWFLSRHRGFAGRGVETVLALPLVLPPTAVGFALLTTLAPDGPVGGALRGLGVDVVFTPKAVVLAMAVMSLPLLVRSARAAFEAVDPRYFALARTLGCSPARAFVRVSLPLAWRGIASGVLLAYARALGEFGATVMVAGNIPGRTRTLSLAIYHESVTGNDSRATTLAAVTVVVAFGALWATEWLARRGRGADAA